MPERTPERPTITVTGTGLANGVPDQCRLHLSLNHMAETAADALALTAGSATKAIAALHGVQADQCDVKTVGLSAQDFFDQTAQKVTARIGSYQLEVVIRPIDAVGAALATLSSAVGDALQIRGMNLGITDPAPLRSEARRMAILDATSKAAEIAGEVGLRLGAILSIQDEHVRSVGFAHSSAMAASGVGGAATMPIEAGSTTTTSAVTLVYAIEE
jgi:uncharacterized protein